MIKLLVLFLGIISLFLSVLIARKFYLAGKIISSQSLQLASASYLLLGIAVIVEAISLLYIPSPSILSKSVGGQPVFPIERMEALAYRGILFAAPLYTITYTLFLVSAYIEYTSIENKEKTIITGIFFPLALYLDYNVVALIVLSLAVYKIIRVYGKTTLPSIILYGTLITSHMLGALSGLYDTTLFLELSVLARALTLPIFYAAIHLSERSS